MFITSQFISLTIFSACNVLLDQLPKKNFIVKVAPSIDKVKILFLKVISFTSINHLDDYSFVFSHSTANLLAALK